MTPASAALISVGDIDVNSLANALKQAPVRVSGRPDPTLTAAEINSLRARIAQRDPGRIWIAVVTPVSVRATGDLTRALSDAINSDGVVIVVAGSNYHVTTTWGSGDAAGSRLGAAVDRPGDSLAVQMRRAIDSFAQADAAAGHPGSDSSERTAPATPGSPAPAQGATGSSGGGSTGTLIAILIPLGIALVAAAAIAGRRARASLRSAHWRKEQSADVHAQAQADLVKLGEGIGALDIDSSMPNASSEGKDAYGRAIACYQDAEQRLRHEDDSYQFQRALDALRSGQQHLQAAEQLFNTPAMAASGSVAGPPSSSGSSLERSGEVVDQLTELAALHDRGVLTDAEFDEEKRKLLSDSRH